MPDSDAEWFDYFYTAEDGDLVHVAIDIGIAGRVPVAELPFVTILRCQYSAGPEVLVSKDDLRRFEEITAHFLQSAGRHGEIRYVSRMVTGGNCLMACYGSAQAPRSCIEEIKARYPAELASVGEEPDPGWLVYRAQHPGADAIRSLMTNLALLKMLEDKGVDAFKIRDVDHTFVFPDLGAQSRFLVEIGGRGWTVRPTEDGGECMVSVSFPHRTDRITTECWTVSFNALALKHGGHYDGWGCML